MKAPISAWLRDVLTASAGDGPVRALEALQMRMRLSPPLDWKRYSTAHADLLKRMFLRPEFGLDVLDYVLQHMREFDGRRLVENGERLNGILDQSGSAWEVRYVDADESRLGLQRRAAGPVLDVVRAMAPGTRAADHLSQAWNALRQRSPDPSTAYRESVRAVESAAKPVILPKDRQATLGKMMGVMRAGQVPLSGVGCSDDGVLAMMEMLWANQIDRHGTDDASVPLNVSIEEADSAFHISVSLVRLFTSGAISRVEAVA